MLLRFSHKIGGRTPEKLIADVVILFEGDADLEGIELHGTAIWRGRKGDPYVTFPQRPGAKSYFDLLRYEDDPLQAQVLKSVILSRYEDALAAGTVETVDMTPVVKPEPVAAPVAPPAEPAIA